MYTMINKKKIKYTLAGVSTNSIRIQNYEAYIPQVNKKEGECFASKIASGAQPYVTISGTASVDYMSGT